MDIVVSWSKPDDLTYIRAVRPIRNAISVSLVQAAGMAERGRVTVLSDETALSLALDLEALGFKPELSFHERK